jgi:hypothetical protein
MCKDRLVGMKCCLLTGRRKPHVLPFSKHSVRRLRFSYKHLMVVKQALLFQQLSPAGWLVLPIQLQAANIRRQSRARCSPISFLNEVDVSLVRLGLSDVLAPCTTFSVLQTAMHTPAPIMAAQSQPGANTVRTIDLAAELMAMASTGELSQASNSVAAVAYKRPRDYTEPDEVSASIDEKPAKATRGFRPLATHNAAMMPTPEFVKQERLAAQPKATGAQVPFTAAHNILFRSTCLITFYYACSSVLSSCHKLQQKWSHPPFLYGLFVLDCSKLYRTIACKT